MAATAKSAARKPAAKKPPVRKPPAKKKTAAKKKAPARKPAAKKAAGSKSDAGYSRAAMEKAKSKSKARVNKGAEQPLMKTLRAEHRHIATVMQLFSEHLKAIEDGELVDTHVVFEVMDYMATWPDRYHHPREDLIYCRVAELDVKAADEVDTLQRDHDQTAARGQKLLREIERWREGDSSGAAVVKLGREYVDHMYEHMNVEEKVVFPHIESVLTLEDWRELAEDDDLRAVADPVFGPRVQREFRNMTRKMRRQVRRGVEHGTMVEWIGIEALMESLEVISMAYDSARTTASDHVQAAIDDSKDIMGESLMRAPLRCVVNNAKLGYRLAEEVIGISRDTLDDLSRVNRARKERVSRLDS